MANWGILFFGGKTPGVINVFMPRAGGMSFLTIVKKKGEKKENAPYRFTVK